MNRQDLKVTHPELLPALTEEEWRELETTGMVIKGERIIRTVTYIKRVADGARRDVQTTARRLFS